MTGLAVRAVGAEIPVIALIAAAAETALAAATKAGAIVVKRTTRIAILVTAIATLAVIAAIVATLVAPAVTAIVTALVAAAVAAGTLVSALVATTVAAVIATLVRDVVNPATMADGSSGASDEQRLALADELRRLRRELDGRGCCPGGPRRSRRGHVW